jgi:hypothetical protein
MAATSTTGTVALDLTLTNATFVSLAVFLCIPVVIFFILK